MDEPWRRLDPNGEVGLVLPPPPPVVNFGEKSTAIREQWAAYQGARKKTLAKDFEWMEAFEQADGVYIVVNYRRFTRYFVNMEDLSCTCPDGFFTFADEGTNIHCKHILYLAISLKQKE